MVVESPHSPRYLHVPEQSQMLSLRERQSRRRRAVTSRKTDLTRGAPPFLGPGGPQCFSLTSLTTTPWTPRPRVILRLRHRHIAIITLQCVRLGFQTPNSTPNVNPNTLMWPISMSSLDLYIRLGYKPSAPSTSFFEDLCPPYHRSFRIPKRLLI